MAETSTSRTSNYHVFLSFRGTDTRYGFTGNLYKALIDKGIHTFIDDEELQSGEEITPALENAIEGSIIAIVVLSQHYASSSFCLEELATIIHCAQSKGLLVLPVFYKVHPSHVRHHKGSYGDALAKHDRRFPDKLQKWKEALRQVANLSGYHFKDGDAYEYKFIENIVNRVSQAIKHPAGLHVADHPVGLESRVAQVMKLLDVGSHDGVHIVGIHGMGGVGKSTLARAVYNKLIAQNFDGFCYLENLREESEKHGLQHLQSILLQEILNHTSIKVTSWRQGASVIEDRLQGKKVLLVLDDVDRDDQLQAILGTPCWFGPGSKVIITSRDVQLLKCHEIEERYKVKELNEDDALQLLTWKAFKKEKADLTYADVLNRVVTYASGLPLALEVIGSNLFGKSIETWESAINQYKRIPHNHIQDILKVSFDTLQAEEKSVFLDIACCFKGYYLKEVEAILSILYDDIIKHHIGVLVDKSLIVKRYGCVTMHDLIQDMGRQIEVKKSPKKPEKRERLWLHKEIIKVLKDKKMLENLTVLKFDWCKSLTLIPDVSHFSNLEELSFSYCDNLVTVDESVGRLGKIKKIWADHCMNLVSFPPIHVTSLEQLDLSYTGLESFPEISVNMENIRKLFLHSTSIKELTISIVNLIGLQKFFMDNYESAVKLPSSILMMPELVEFQVTRWKGVKWVKEEENEETMGSIVSSQLNSLFLSCCNLGDDFFSIIDFTQFVHVKYLVLSGNNFTFLPECIREFQSLWKFNVSNCKHLLEIRGVPPNLMQFDARNCKSLNSSSISMFINEELYNAKIEAKMEQFYLPGAWIPEWFDHKTRGASISFWFRNKLPAKILCLLTAPLDLYNFTPMILFNGRIVMEHNDFMGKVELTEMDNTYIFNLFYLPDLVIEKEWNHVRFHSRF